MTTTNGTYTAAEMREAFVKGANCADRHMGCNIDFEKRAASEYPDPDPPRTPTDEDARSRPRVRAWSTNGIDVKTHQIEGELVAVGGPPEYTAPTYWVKFGRNISVYDHAELIDTPADSPLKWRDATLDEDGLAFINRRYGTSFKVGCRVVYTGTGRERFGKVITGGYGQLRIKLDDYPFPGSFHPKWKLEVVPEPANAEEERE